MAIDMNDPEVKAAIAEAVAAAVEDEVAGLKSKNAELKRDLLEARKGKTIDPAELEARDARIEELTAKIAASDKAAKDALKAAEKATATLAQEQAFTHKLVAENGLVQALTQVGVTDPAYLDAVKALHLANVKVAVEGDSRTALYGDKPLADAIKEWAGSDVGKKFVAAPVNSGAGATGGKGASGTGKTVSPQEFATMGAKERAAFMDAGGSIADAA